MHGHRCYAELGDISTHGCSIRSDADWLRMGMFITVQLGEDASLEAIIRWVREDAAGLEFLRPISPDQLEWHARMESDSHW